MLEISMYTKSPEKMLAPNQKIAKSKGLAKIDYLLIDLTSSCAVKTGKELERTGNR